MRTVYMLNGPMAQCETARNMLSQIHGKPGCQVEKDGLKAGYGRFVATFTPTQDKKFQAIIPTLNKMGIKVLSC